jgi:hypothetical protein
LREDPVPDVASTFPYRHFEAYLPPDNPTYHNPPFGEAAYRVLIARLSSFRDVDRSMPHLYLYHEVRRALPAAYVDLAFFPGEHERAALAAGNLPYWIGTQSLQPASAFDLILISNAYTLELINLPYLLLRSGMPLCASERDERWPILLLGGSNAMASQAAIRADGDSLVDGIYFGEGEGMVERLVATLAQASGSKQEALVRAAAAVDGLWVAGSFRETRKAVCAPDVRYLATHYPLLNTPEAHSARLQINYGCPAFCSFCFEGYDRKPYRELPLADLLAAARRLKRIQGVPDVSLYSFNFNTHAAILPMLLELHRLFRRVSVLSQRADILQRAGYLLEAEIEAGKRSFTVGIEGISERQRAWLHKSLPTADLLALLDRILAARIRELKLFFMLTGHENDDDVEAFRDLVRAIKGARRAQRSGVRVIFSFGLLVRMPFTPLRYDRLYLDEAAWRPLIGQAKSACETNGFEFRMAFDWDAYCTNQVLAMGGYWLVEPLIELAQQGHCFDAGLPPGYWEALQGRLVEAGHWNEAFLGEKGPDYPYPLAFVQADIPPDFLYRQYKEAKAGIDTGYCLGGPGGEGHCLACGACADPAQRRAIVAHQMQLPERGPYLAQLHTLVARKRRLKPAWYVVRVDDAVTGVHPEFVNALVFQALLQRYPALVDNLLDVQESLFTTAPPPDEAAVTKPGRYPVVRGESVYALYAWDVDALQQILAANEQATGSAGDLHVEVLGPAEGFTRGAFRRCTLDMHLPAAYFEGARRQLEGYLDDAYVPYTRRREPPQHGGQVRYRLEIPEKGLRKRILYGGYMEIGEEGLTAGLEIGPKFDLLGLLERFAPAYHVPYADLRISQIRWS